MTDVMLTKNEARLAGTLLRDASDEYSNHSCNDLERPEWFPQDEWDALALKIAKWGCTLEEYKPERRILTDWLVMEFLAHVLAPKEVQS